MPGDLSYGVEEITSSEIHQILGNINKKLEELLIPKHDLDELHMRTKNMGRHSNY